MGFTGPLQAAAAKGDTQTLKLLLDQGQDPNTLNEYQRTALLAAAYKGHVDAVKLLLERGADANYQAPGGWTALIWAAEYGYTEIVKLLLEHGARLDLRTGPPFSWTAYEWAAGSNKFEAAAAIKRAAEQRGVELEGGGEAVALTAPARPAGRSPRAVGTMFGGTQTPPASGGLSGAFGGGATSVPGGAVQQEADDDWIPEPPAPGAPLPASRKAQGAAVASDVDEPAYKTRVERPDDFALVIGISKYRDIPEAEFADRDAQAMKRHLLAMGYPEENIVSVMGDHATNSSIAQKLERWLPMNVNARSTVFVYYSGHGAPDAESNQAYLVPWDGQPGALAETAFPLSRFYADLQKLPAKRVLVALDACFSGAGGRSVLAKGARPLVAKIDMAAPQNGKLIVLAASKADQISGTLEDKGHGAFTYFMLKGLNGEAAGDAGRVTVGSLYAYLSKRVSASAHRQEREQNPQLSPPGETAGSLLLR